MISVRRGTQLICLVLFVLLLLWTGFPLPGWLPAGRVFALDPLVVLGPLLTAGIIIQGVSVLLLLLFATALLGRFFCGYVCPLGTTLDLSHPLVAGSGRSNNGVRPRPGLRRLKYLLLILLLVSALLGLNLLHWGSPLSLAARLYALIILPCLKLVSQLIDQHLVSFVQDADRFLPGSMRPAAYQSLSVLILFVLGLVLAGRLTPRFWCRYLCPAGAVLALAGQRPLIRRRVSKDCTACGLCRKTCPMQAIPDQPERNLPSECILCQQCRRICPEGAVSFQPGCGGGEPVHLPGRRAALQALGLGGILALLGSQAAQGSRNPEPIRPPGAVPEPLFDRLCIRCGLCMTVCPTNMLHPDGLGSGLAGHLAAVAVPRRGPCEPGCNACTKVCPTGAIRSLDLKEKMWAKMGTAVINRWKCLAWAYDRSCLVCDEACPYGAVDLKKVPDIDVYVPFVSSTRCTGCGACEHACPVQGKSAITVSTMFELRLARGSYVQAGRRLGLAISRERTGDSAAGSLPEQELPPGFSE